MVARAVALTCTCRGCAARQRRRLFLVGEHDVHQAGLQQAQQRIPAGRHHLK
jgi:hypothetical protein